MTTWPETPVEQTGSGGRRFRRWAVDSARDLAVIALWFAAAAALAAFIWSRVTPLPAFTRTRTQGVMGEEEFARQFATDGWFLVIAGVIGLISGVALMLLRRRDPILTVLLIAAGGALAAWLMAVFGLYLGPESPSVTLAQAAVGARVPVQLKAHADVVYLVWSTAALSGALLVLWQSGAREREVSEALGPMGTNA